MIFCFAGHIPYSSFVDIKILEKPLNSKIQVEWICGHPFRKESSQSKLKSLFPLKNESSRINSLTKKIKQKLIILIYA